MLNSGLNELAFVRIGGFRFSHGSGPGGFAWLLIGLVAIAIGIWAVSRASEGEPAKN